jgi:hypothetical protein
MGKYSLELEVSIAPTDSNMILGCHAQKKGRIFKKVKNEIAYLVHGKGPKTPLTSFKISAHRFSPQYMDKDNFHALLKPYYDGLKLAGVIADDKWEYVNDDNSRIFQTKIKMKDKKKIVIKIEEA